jgi:hypothetical protein
MPQSVRKLEATREARNAKRRAAYQAKRKGTPRKKPGAPEIKRTPELSALICERLQRTNGGIETICREFDDLPCADWVFAWRREDEAFAEALTQARETRDELHVDAAFRELDRLVEDHGTTDLLIPGKDGEDSTTERVLTDPRYLNTLATIARTKCDVAMKKAALFSPQRYGPRATTVELEVSWKDRFEGAKKRAREYEEGKGADTDA